MTEIETTPSPAPSAETAPAGPGSAGAGVPWSTLLPLALLLAAADAFWTTTLRAAVGDISRTQELSASYWRAAVLASPAYVLAVLAVFTLRLRSHGASRRAVLTTAALVAVAATVAATGLSVASAAYDYTLQSGRLQTMNGMQSDCGRDCLVRQQWLTIGAHLRATAYVSVALLVTNLVVVGWFVVLAGGRLRVASDAPGRGRRDQGLGRLLVVAALVASAVIHAAVVPEHLEEWTAAGVFFVVLTVAELVVAQRVWTCGTRRLLPLAVLVSVVPLAIWAVSRTVGLPFAPEAGPEAVGLADSTACLLEVVSLVGALRLLRRERSDPRPASAHLRALAVVAVVAAGSFGLASALPGWVDGASNSGGTTGSHGSR